MNNNTIRAIFVDLDKESKPRHDLGVFLYRNKDEGLAWRRAYQLVPPNNVTGLIPNGCIEWEPIK